MLQNTSIKKNMEIWNKTQIHRTQSLLLLKMKTQEVINLLNEKYELEHLQAKDYRKILKIQGSRIIRGKKISIIENHIHEKVMELNKNPNQNIFRCNQTSKISSRIRNLA